ncbi:MAG: radical SAM protein [Phycisphaeraceae bacterium]|nr:radical SAM protein [Phycisphaeraceae bacterium]
MNELDSELVRGSLAALGYRITADDAGADVILLNTCSVREQAENKALSEVGILGRRKAAGRRLVLGLIGCLAEREGARLLSRFPQIDFLCGPGELDRLPHLLDNVLRAEALERAERVALQGSSSRRSKTLEAAADSLELLDLSRAFDPEQRADGAGRSAYVRITRGCNKFCTYCVVPRTRGPEIHRPPDAIVDECRRLANAGVHEITLLGQTVNHYLYVHGAAVGADGRELAQVGPPGAAFRDEAAMRALARHGSGRAGQRVTTFADLLHRIHEEVPHLARLRFVTSYPRDFGDDILDVMAASPRLCRYLHLPAQSGSNTVLARMNRGYTREIYLDLIDRVRDRLPDVCIAGDIIVGFCGETDAEYDETRSLLERVRYKNTFIFKYSPRPGTTAFDRQLDDVPEAVKRRRNNDLLALQAVISREVHAGWVGRTETVLVERVTGHRSRGQAPHRPGTSRAVELRWTAGSGPGSGNLAGSPGTPPAATGSDLVQVSGRTRGDLITVFDVPAAADPSSLVGSLVEVRIVGSGPLLLHGEVQAPAWAAPGVGA